MSGGDEESLAVRLEKLSVIRSRIRQNAPWIQWPVNAARTFVEGEEEGEEMEHYPVSTKSLELNVDAVREMVAHYCGYFADISPLTAEAPFLFQHLSNQSFVHISRFTRCSCAFLI